MDEKKLIKLLEKHAENIISEIMKPIENKFRAQIHDVDVTLTKIEKKIKSIATRQISLTRKIGVLGEFSDSNCTRIYKLENNTAGKDEFVIMFNSKIAGLHAEISCVKKEQKKIIQDVSASVDFLIRKQLDKEFKQFLHDFEYRCVGYLSGFEKRIDKMEGK